MTLRSPDELWREWGKPASLADITHEQRAQLESEGLELAALNGLIARRWRLPPLPMREAAPPLGGWPDPFEGIERTVREEVAPPPAILALATLEDAALRMGRAP